MQEAHVNYVARKSLPDGCHASSVPKAGGTQEARGGGGDAPTLAAAEMGLTDAATDSEVFDAVVHYRHVNRDEHSRAPAPVPHREMRWSLAPTSRAPGKNGRDGSPVPGV